MTVPAALQSATVKINSRRIARDENGQYTVAISYQVNAARIEDALTAQDIPQENDTFTVAGVTLPLKTIDVSEPSGAGNTDNAAFRAYTVNVVFGFPSGGSATIYPPVGELPRIRMDIGVTGQRVEVDVEDPTLTIGDQYFWERIPGTNNPVNFLARVNPITRQGMLDADAEIGAEVLVPTLAIQITMALSTSPPSVDLFRGLQGKCNNTAFKIGARQGFEGFAIPAEYALYLGAVVDDLPNGTWGVTHRIVAGAIDLPANPPPGQFVTGWDGSDWASSQVPYRYIMKPRKDQPFVDEQDAESGERTIRLLEQKVEQYRIFRRYKTGNFGVLGAAVTP